MRKKLVFGILMMIVVMTTIGSLGIYLIGRVADMDRAVFEEDYSSVHHLQRISNDVLLLNARYLPRLLDATAVGAVEITYYEEKRSEIETGLDNLGGTQAVRVGDNEIVERMRSAYTNYFATFDSWFDAASPVSEEERLILQQKIYRSTERLTMLSEQLMEVKKVQMAEGAERSSQFAETARRLIGGGLVFATIVASLLYWRMGELVMEPVARLARSVREIQNRNFELSLPVKSNDEMGELSAAFNDMASDMRSLLREHDDRLVEANMDNQAVMEAFPFPLILMDTEGEIRQINPAAEYLFEKLKTPARLPTKVGKLFDSIREGDEDFVPDELSESILFRVDDVEFFYLPRMFQIRAKTGENRGWAILLADVSRLRWMDEMRTDLLSTVSHEIKTPLTSIRMVLHLLDEQKNGELNDRQARMVDSAKDNCERLLVVLDDLLQMSRLESGFSNLELAPVSPAELTREAVEQWLPLIEEQGMRLSVDLEEGLPIVPLDRLRIVQVLGNYLSNALQHGRTGGDLYLSVAMKTPELIRFMVRDEGAGVPEVARDHIFEKFYRAPEQDGQGTGLGLAICREIVHAHGGRLGFQNVPSIDGRPAQTEFYFDLPLAA